MRIPRGPIEKKWSANLRLIHLAESHLVGLAGVEANDHVQVAPLFAYRSLLQQPL
jgi:hypothetical protein